MTNFELFDDSEYFEGWSTFLVRGSDTGTEFDYDHAPPRNALRASSQAAICDECRTLWLYLPDEECPCGAECVPQQTSWA